MLKSKSVLDINITAKLIQQGFDVIFKQITYYSECASQLEPIELMKDQYYPNQRDLIGALKLSGKNDNQIQKYLEDANL